MIFDYIMSITSEMVREITILPLSESRMSLKQQRTKMICTK